jgi:uncharacterized paraquat-inducible protein A
MHIATHTCPDCGTLVAANELEKHRTMKCPGIGCETVLRFIDLSEADHDHILANLERYRIE